MGSELRRIGKVIAVTIAVVLVAWLSLVLATSEEGITPFVYAIF